MMIKKTTLNSQKKKKSRRQHPFGIARQKARSWKSRNPLTKDFTLILK